MAIHISKPITDAVDVELAQAKFTAKMSIVANSRKELTRVRSQDFFFESEEEECHQKYVEALAEAAMAGTELKCTVADFLDSPLYLISTASSLLAAA
ncbi:MAG: hypothetical protein U0804_02685 [Gemmataceae bacterium]